MVFMGVYPRPFLERADQSVKAIQQRVSGGEKGGDFAEVTTDANAVHDAPDIHAK